MFLERDQDYKIPKNNESIQIQIEAFLCSIIHKKLQNKKAGSMARLLTADCIYCALLHKPPEEL